MSAIEIINFIIINFHAIFLVMTQFVQRVNSGPVSL